MIRTDEPRRSTFDTMSGYSNLHTGPVSPHGVRGGWWQWLGKKRLSEHVSCYQRPERSQPTPRRKHHEFAPSWHGTSSMPVGTHGQFAGSIARTV